jgi:peptidoglycan/xylan/chitin deacetylase (PgdA/CDA1 family)
MSHLQPLCDAMALTAGPWVAQRESLLILMYHRVEDGPRNQYSVCLQAFHEQLAYLVDDGYEFLTMRQVHEKWPAVLSGAKSVVLTFDDLWASQTDACLPAMAERGAAGTFFVSTAHVRDERHRPTDGPFDTGVAELGSWKDVELLHRSGMEIGAHTHSHRKMSDLDPGAFAQELATSNRILVDMVKSPVTSFAFPYGRPSTYRSWMLPMLAEHGYTTACTTRWGRPTAQSNLLELPRIAIDGFDNLGRFARKLKGHYDFLRWKRR